MSGSLADVARARKHQKNGEPLLWFRVDGQEYVVRDRDVIAHARALWNDVYESSLDHGEIAAAAQALGAEALGAWPRCRRAGDERRASRWACGRAGDSSPYRRPSLPTPIY